MVYVLAISYGNIFELYLGTDDPKNSRTKRKAADPGETPTGSKSDPITLEEE